MNPTERTLEVLRLERGQWVIVATHGGDAIVRAEPFDAVAIDLLELWGETRAPKRRPSPSQKGRRRRRASSPLYESLGETLRLASRSGRR